jgi:hypothetical protein
VNQLVAALEKETLNKEEGALWNSPAMHEILFHVTEEQLTAVAARKTEKNT